MNEPSYLLILLERQYLAGMEAGLRAKIQLLKQAIKANKYDVNANRELPLVKDDYNEISKTLSDYNNIINLRLQEVYNFKFKSIHVEPLHEFEKGGREYKQESTATVTE